MCGRLLAGLGHDVVKCEPQDGDYLRRSSPNGNTGEGSQFAEVNASKRGIVRNVGPSDDVLMSRIGEADIAIVDGDPTLDGLSAVQLHHLFPKLIVVAVTTSGLDGLPDHSGGDSLLAEAFGGMAYMIGEPTQRPLALGGEQAGYSAGMVAFLGAMLALRRRNALGVGDLVDVAMCDVVAYMDWKSDTRFTMTGTAPRRSGSSSGRWRMVRARDGWVGVIFEPKQWKAVVDLVDDIRLEDSRLERDEFRSESPDAWWPIIEEWAAQLPKKVIYEQAQMRGLPFGHLVTVSEIPEIPQYISRGFTVDDGRSDGQARSPVVGAPFGPGKLPWSSFAAPSLGQNQAEIAKLWRAPQVEERRIASRLIPGGAGPLAGVIAIDLGTITAGAATSRLLADYGATVIKVESPDHPDPFRRWIVDNESPNDDESSIAPMFDSNNAGKLSLALDLKATDGLDALKRLATRADVLVENFGIGVTERLGIDFGQMHKLNPNLIYLSLSSQGQEGPEANSRSYGSTLDLLSGLASVSGYDADHPLWSSVAVNYPDQLASLFGASMAAYCLATGATGLHLDLSQREVVSWTLGGFIRDRDTSGQIVEPTGNSRPGCTPRDTFPCAGDDAWVALNCRTDNQRESLASIVSGSLINRDLEWWVSNSELVYVTIASWTEGRSADECVKALTAAGVPAAPVLTAETRAHSLRFRSRRVFLDDHKRRLKGFPMVMHGYAPPNSGACTVDQSTCRPDTAHHNWCRSSSHMKRGERVGSVDGVGLYAAEVLMVSAVWRILRQARWRDSKVHANPSA